MNTDTAPIPAVRPPVDKPMRLVGVSHSNNSYSLVDHASANDQLHHIFLVVKQHVAGILADVQYYKIVDLKNELIALGTDVASLERDRAFEESRDKYHRHFWRADDEAENKQLIVKLSEVAYALLDYKQNCCTESRGPYALDEARLETLCKKHLYELQNFRRELAQFVNTARDRNAQVTRLSAPLQSQLEWHQYKSPLDDPSIRRPLPYECTLTTRDTIGPRTDPPDVDGHKSGVKQLRSQWDVPDLSGKPGAANSGTHGTLTSRGRYGGRHIYERNINERRKPTEQEIQHVSSRYKHYHGLCE
ncbi:uncharacterized protein LOC129261456 [Lytechinus pictus]|uniref:uncharacterized protein LOC129261456 n=1 Tax=Lytechinus pictus TaxID=7653 RepID=UPI0030B9EC93